MAWESPVRRRFFLVLLAIFGNSPDRSATCHTAAAELPAALDSSRAPTEDLPMTTASEITAIFDAAPAPPGTERIDLLYARRGVVIECITSSGSQPAQSYCQPEDEWVLLLRGQAEMSIADTTVTLHAGDCLRLPAGTPHAVHSTSENALWLAVHVEGVQPEFLVASPTRNSTS
jgi:cupin 2 domain-containing protein